MPYFIVDVPTSFPARTLHGHNNACLVWAESSDDAKGIAKTHFDGDSDDAWNSATVTEIEAPVDMEGWTVRVVVTDPTGPTVVADVEATGGEGDGITDILADIVTGLNATDIDNAAFAVDTLTVADAADSLGDHAVQVWVLPPGFTDPKSVDGFVVSITDEGSSGDALEVVFDVSREIPALVGSFRT